MGADRPAHAVDESDTRVGEGDAGMGGAAHEGLSRVDVGEVGARAAQRRRDRAHRHECVRVREDVGLA